MRTKIWGFGVWNLGAKITVNTEVAESKKGKVKWKRVQAKKEKKEEEEEKKKKKKMMMMMMEAVLRDFEI